VETPPENVRLLIGGAEYPCGVIRDPDLDEDGCAAWVAVPREPLPPAAASSILAGVPVGIRAGMLPAKSVLLMDLDLPIPPGDRP
jgi:hypothetical protein